MVSTMRRTVRLATLELNSNKISTICDLQQSYAKAKDRFLLVLGSATMWHFLRNGDLFHCRNPYWNCNWQGGADKVAAMNLMAITSDREITLYTPYRDLKNLLDIRFQRRLESRTGDAGVSMETVSDAVLTRVVEGDTTARGRTPSEPRRKNLGVGDTNGVASQSPVLTVGTGETQRLASENKRMPRNV